MHRARIFNPASFEYDWYHPRIRFVRVPRSKVDILGEFEKTSKKLAELAAFRVGQTLSDNDDFIFMPVHEMQLNNVLKRFCDVEVLPPEIYLPALGQSSIRYVRQDWGERVRLHELIRCH